jgi:hypothetical protein
VQHLIVAQTVKGGRAPAQVGSWPGQLLDGWLASMSVRILLVALMVVAIGVILSRLALVRPTPPLPGPASPQADLERERMP